ncbi:MAG: hypothetical protein ABSG57_13990 [Candidatus Bathyarchaeia archaeon]
MAKPRFCIQRPFRQTNARFRASDKKRTDDLELRRRILSLSQSEARRLGIGKSTIHYLRKNASNRSTFRPYDMMDLEALESKGRCSIT